MSQLSTQPYKGTRDFYPEEMRLRRWMFNKLREVLARYGYEEYDGPMLEPFELYAAKTSEEIVNDQLYWMVDRGERKLAVRPEMTPTLARMVAAKQNDLPRPIRWYSIPNLWRYERPQRGRLREHWQLNVDVFGGEPLSEDLEICQVIVAIMQGFGAREGYEVRLNHRGLSNAIFSDMLHIPAEKIGVTARLLDAAPKMGATGFREALAKEAFGEPQITGLLDLLDASKADELAKKLSDNPHFKHMAELQNLLKSLGLGNHFRYDPSIMRGFMYYTGMVLEVYDLHPDNNRALFGGGRYDNLVGMFGGKPLAGVGFGMGDVTFQHFLEVHKLLPADLTAARGVYIAHLGEAEFLAAQKLAQNLREAFARHKTDIRVLTALSPDKPRKIFSTAEKLGARAVVFVGPDDVAKDSYPMKDLVTGAQSQGKAGELAEAFVQGAF